MVTFPMRISVPGRFAPKETAMPPSGAIFKPRVVGGGGRGGGVGWWREGGRNEVAGRARRFIKTAAALDTERFRRGDLDVIDVIAVPKRLEDAVAKAQHEQVLHGVLAEVVIDAVDLLFVENVEDNLIQGFGLREISP